MLWHEGPRGEDPEMSLPERRLTGNRHWNGARILFLAWCARALVASLAILLCQARLLSAQALTGTTGLVSVPTAEMPADGSIAAGLNVVNAGYHGYGNPGFEAHPALVQFASVGFLPFVEVGLRLTRVADVPRQALGDRMVSVRVRLLKQGEHTPAVAAGAHDLLGTRYFHAVYVVASRQVEPVAGVGTMSFHAGYGGNPMSLSVAGQQFVGLFGGVSVAPRPWLALLAEYDGERVNAGFRLHAGRLALLTAVHDLNALSAGISYTHRLK